MNKFQNKDYVNDYRRRRRLYDEDFRDAEKRACAKYYKKRKAAEEACPELAAERKAKKAVYMREWHRKRREEKEDG